MQPRGKDGIMTKLTRYGWRSFLVIVSASALAACSAEDPTTESLGEAQSAIQGLQCHGKGGGKAQGKGPCRTLETLSVPTDGSSVQSQAYASTQILRVKISGQIVWGVCDPVSCPHGGSC